jgi:hypothetical protein
LVVGSSKPLFFQYSYVYDSSLPTGTVFLEKIYVHAHDSTQEKIFFHLL